MNPFSALLDLFIPRICHVCKCRLMKSEEFVCSSCLERLPLTHYHKYWDNKKGPNSDLNPMEQRFVGQLPLERACAPFFYTRDSSLASLVHDFKYRNFPSLAIAMGKTGALLLEPTGFFKGTDILLPVPLHWRKKFRRGYNQSEMIAKGISEITGIPIGTNLKARKAHRTQTSLSHEQRITNTKGIFHIENPESLTGKTIMLVDDICTTGATLLSAGEAITASVKNEKLRIFTLGIV